MLRKQTSKHSNFLKSGGGSKRFEQTKNIYGCCQISIKKYLTALLIWGMTNKTTMRYCHKPLGWLKLKGLNIPSVGEYVEKLELSYTADGNVSCTTILIS